MGVLLSPQEIADAITERCTAQKISAVAMCRACGVAVNTVSNIRVRGSYPRCDTLFNIAEYLGCTVNDLLYRPEKSDD